MKKISLKHQKPKNPIGLKFPHKCMIYCMKHENKCKRKGKRVLPALEEKNLAKRTEENNKNLDWSLDRSDRERKNLKTF